MSESYHREHIKPVHHRLTFATRVPLDIRDVGGMLGPSAMNKTLYIRDEDGPIWDRARELAGEKLSRVIVTALKRFVVDKEAELRLMERIEIAYSDRDQRNRPVVKAFHGRWLIPPEENYVPASIFGQCCAVGVSVKGGVVVFEWTAPGPLIVPTAHSEGRLYLYPSFEAARRENTGLPGFGINIALNEAEKRQGVMVEQLDI
jgi:hypothetical protein